MKVAVETEALLKEHIPLAVEYVEPLIGEYVGAVTVNRTLVGQIRELKKQLAHLQRLNQRLTERLKESVQAGERFQFMREENETLRKMLATTMEELIKHDDLHGLNEAQLMVLNNLMVAEAQLEFCEKE